MKKNSLIAVIVTAVAAAIVGYLSQGEKAVAPETASPQNAVVQPAAVPTPEPAPVAAPEAAPAAEAPAAPAAPAEQPK